MGRETKTYEVTCAASDFQAVSTALAKREIPTEVSEISMIAQTSVRLDAQTLSKVLSLLEKLEDHDDVQNVYSDLDIPEEVMAQIAEQPG